MGSKARFPTDFTNILTMATEAWVTLATNDSYAVGVMVLAHSLQAVKTTRPLVVMVGDHVSPAMRSQLSQVCCLVKDVSILDSEDSAHLALLARPELGVTFTKLHCWTLTDYTKCVFLDADTLVVRHCDELFDREELSAAPDAGWPDCFNSGVFVYRPSMETYSKLLEFAVNQGSFDGGDQGLLNLYFSDWATKDINRRLPFTYNMTATAVYSYRPAYQQFGGDVRIVHFIGSPKPWQAVDGNSPHPQASREHVGIWCTIFHHKVQDNLTPEMSGIAATFADMNIKAIEAAAAVVLPTEAAEGAGPKEMTEQEHREPWERGEIDYKGRDAFDNLMKKMQETMNKKRLQLHRGSCKKEERKEQETTKKHNIKKKYNSTEEAVKRRRGRNRKQRNNTT